MYVPRFMSTMTRSEILDQHYALQEVIQTNYRLRDNDSQAFARAIQACEQQIALSARAAQAYLGKFKGSTLPAHVGYRQLAIIREKQGHLNEAIRLSERALKLGWCGDWERRIKRCSRKSMRNCYSADFQQERKPEHRPRSPNLVPGERGK